MDAVLSTFQVAAPIPVSGFVQPRLSLELTVLMPCLNEARTVARCVRQAQTFLLQHGLKVRCW